MKRIAFFVEGQTEQIFVNRLAREIFGFKQVNIIQKQFRGGVNTPKQEIVRNISLSKKAIYEILILDCGSDNRVKSEMLENIVNLKNNGYRKVVGLRDLYPLTMDDLGKLEKGLRFMPMHLRNYESLLEVIISVHEIEAWFLGEINHFRKIDKKLTNQFIKNGLGFDPSEINPEEREHPAKDLDDIYKLVDKSYTKRYDQTLKIVNKLDFDYIKYNLRYRISALNKLISVLEELK